MKAIGILFLINVLLIAGYFFFSTSADTKRVIAFSGIGFLIGIGLILGDRITGVKVAGVAELTAATQRAVAGAENVEAIQHEVEAHRDSIQMIVRDANKARDDITRIETYATTAKQKAEEAETASRRATQAQEELTRLADFNLLLTKTTNDDRDAYVALMTEANEGKSPFKEIALQAVIKTATNRGLQLGMAPENWPKFHFDPAKATLEEYERFSKSPRTDVSASVVRALWQQERFSKKEKLTLLAKIIDSTKSITVLEAACQTMDQESKLNVNILAWGQYQSWWLAHASDYK